jgi:hypothetical protein
MPFDGTNWRPQEKAPELSDRARDTSRLEANPAPRTHLAAGLASSYLCAPAGLVTKP